MDLKEIYIGQLIKQRVSECDISITRISKFLQCSEEEIEKIYEKKSVEADVLLKLSKLLEYDFFRIYSQHLILYSPQASIKYNCAKTQLPSFRKNIYTREIIEFILDLVETQQKSKAQIIQEYGIPKTTLYKWIAKYQK
ncbi:transposase [Chryseobacterium oranimense]|uniref:transposase n=1 Tax=Chryseobacterium oranimense TaxID=421058 RepID=UPI0021AEE78D|nr:transposase [Chryseobacterium oranimense]UWX62063.1 transposase [Chryseobacterium oranimense]